jgi:tRNA(fMet)-specific endonuclease VapC
MAFLLATGAVIALLNRPDAPIHQRLRQHPPSEVFVSAIMLHELFYGAFKSARAARNVALVESLRFTALDFTREDARAAGDIRATLATQGIGPHDVLIAGQTQARGLTLITRNTAEFARVPGLRIEDWEG